MDYLNRIKDLIIDISFSIINCLRRMDSRKVKSLLVFDKDVFKGLITIGDIQRAIISDTDLNMPICQILDTHKVYAFERENIDSIKNKMMRLRAECMPVLNEEGDLIDVLFWKDIFLNDKLDVRNNLNIPVVIMAGGKGTRLSPLTNIYPKPLIPIGEKTIVETIMDKFVTYGCNDFHISVNYKADTIKNYFNLINNSAYRINYFQEERPLGTAGSLRLLKGTISTTFFVSNCDILIEEDYSSILDYHRKSQNELTVVAAVKTFTIPYGTIVTGEEGQLETIEEKPTLSFKINTGLYVLEPTLLDDIPEDFFHITHLMEKLKAEGRRVGVYPISQNDWTDMGDWSEYLKMINVR